MATFKVGQRVRIVGNSSARNRHMVGKEAVIVAPLGQHEGSMFALAYGIDVSGYPCPGFAFWTVRPEHIAPLTDPGCERFLESIRQLKPLEEVA